MCGCGRSSSSKVVVVPEHRTRLPVHRGLTTVASFMLVHDKMDSSVAQRHVYPCELVHDGIAETKSRTNAMFNVLAEESLYYWAQVRTTSLFPKSSEPSASTIRS